MVLEKVDKIRDLLLSIKGWAEDTRFEDQKYLNVFDSDVSYFLKNPAIVYRHRSCIFEFNLERNATCIKAFTWTTAIDGYWKVVDLDSERGIELTDSMLENLKSMITMKLNRLRAKS